MKTNEERNQINLRAAGYLGTPDTDARMIACAYCNAPAGDPCTTKTGNLAAPHAGRIAAYRTATNGRPIAPISAAATGDPIARLPLGTPVQVDESAGLGRSVWYGRVTHNNPESPYLSVDGRTVRKYEVTAIPAPSSAPSDPSVSYADRDSFDFDPAEEDAAIARQLEPESGEHYGENPAADRIFDAGNDAYNAAADSPMAEREQTKAIAIRAQQLLELRRIGLESAASFMRQQSEDATRAWLHAVQEEERIKHDYSNPHNLRDWQNAQKAANAARDRMSQVSADSGRVADIARYAAMLDSELAAELARHVSMLELGLAADHPMTKISTETRDRILDELKTRVAAYNDARAELGLAPITAEDAAEDAREQQQQEARIDADRTALGLGRPSMDTPDQLEPDPPYLETDRVELGSESSSAEDDSSVPPPITLSYLDARRKARLRANGARNTRDKTRNPGPDLLAAVDRADRELSQLHPPAEWTRPTESIARWDHAGFTVLLWSRYAAGLNVPNTEKHAYRIIDTDSTLAGGIIFEGCDFGPRPIHPWDSAQSFGSMIRFKTLQPGDTDQEYFDNYTPAQLAWCQSMRAQELGIYGDDLEMNRISYKPAELGSVSEATHRPEDLIPRFLDVLESLSDPRHAQYRAEYARLSAELSTTRDDRYSLGDAAAKTARVAMLEAKAPALITALSDFDPDRPSSAHPAYTALAAYHRAARAGHGVNSAKSLASRAVLDSAPGIAECYAAAAAELACSVYSAEQNARRESWNDHPVSAIEDQISYLLNENIWTAMEDHAPDGSYFGAHPGDGADFGYWPSEDDEDGESED